MKQLTFLSAIVLLAACGNSSGNLSNKDSAMVRNTVMMDKGRSTSREHRHNTEAQAQGPEGNGTYSTSSANPANAPSQQEQQTTAPAKKGWSSAAKDAAIGGGAGIVAGAVLDKNNRVVGGAVGGLIGAGAGYLIGRSRDRKTGRVVKHSSTSNQ